jgi:hypothetical protein
MIEKCSICGEYLFYSYHTCKPKYFVWREDDGIEEYINAPTIRADGHEDAAIKYADSDFEFPNNETVYVCSVVDYDNLMGEDGVWSEDSDLTSEGLEKLKKICLLFELEGEIVRNFNVYKKDLS